MPKEYNDKTALSIWWSEDIELKFQNLCENTGIPKPKLAADIINEGVTFNETFAKIGFLHLVIAIRDIKDWVTNADKKEKLEGKTYTIWVTKDLIKRMEKICSITGISKSKLASNLIKMSVEDGDFTQSLSEIAYKKALEKWSSKIKSKIKRSIKNEGLSIK